MDLQSASFIQSAIEIVLSNLDDGDFNGNELASALSLSREQTHRKLKKSTSLSTGRFIRFIRLLKAYEYLLKTDFTGSEISYKVGFENPSYFNKCFKDDFGISPGEIKKMEDNFSPRGKGIYEFYLHPEIHEILKKAILLPWDSDSSPKKNYQSLIWIALLIIVPFGIYFFQKEDSSKFHLPQNSRIAVIPFKNETGNPQLNSIGEIASSWIATQLDNVEGVKTVPAFTVDEYLSSLGVLSNDQDNRPTFSELVDARNLLTGNYYLSDNEIYFDVNLIDGITQESIYHFPINKGHRDSVMSIIEEIRLDVLGLLVNLEDVKIGKLKPPSYDAYSAYLKGLAEMKDGLYPSKAHNYFREANTLEPNFVMAQIFMSWFVDYSKVDSIMEKVEKIPTMTQYELALYLEQSNMFQRRYKEALQVCLDVLDDYQQDYYFNIMAGHKYKALFMPQKALEVLAQVQDPKVNEMGLIWHYFKTRNKAESLLMLHRFDECVEYLKSIPEDLQNSAIPELWINTYVTMGKERISVDSLLNTYRDQSFYPGYLVHAAWEYKLKSNDSSSKYFANKAIEFLKEIPNEGVGDYDLIDAYFLAGDLESAESLINNRLKLQPQLKLELEIYLTYVRAKRGSFDQVENLLIQYGDKSELKWRRHEYPYHIAYHKARILALAGFKKEAISQLAIAKEEGQLRHYWDYERDIFLVSLFDDPDFQKLVQVES